MRLLIIFFITIFSGISIASDAEIVNATAERTPSQKYNITVTVKHADEGWEHYANAWRVYSIDGTLIGERVLHHPHVKEQPFTRTLLGLAIPSDLVAVNIVAVCSKTGASKKSYTLKLQ